MTGDILHTEQIALQGQSAWVVFSGQTDRPWLKILKAGYRHCFVILNDGQRWLSFDPMLHCTDLRVYHHIPPTFDLPQWFSEKRYHVQPAQICAQAVRPAPVAFLTCVESVKRILGIHARRIITPWQLCRYLSVQQDQTTL